MAGESPCHVNLHIHFASLLVVRNLTPAAAQLCLA